jgi:hypothetical protein
MPIPTDLEQSIVRTLCWFSVFKYPLTRFEIWKWLLEPRRGYDLSEVYRVLDESKWLREKLVFTSGHYSIKDEFNVEKSLDDRRFKFLDSVKKYKKLRRAAIFFSALSSVRAVAAVNTLSMWQTTSKSDIDLYIITKPESIWSSRFWVVLPFLFFGKRPHVHVQDNGEEFEQEDSFCFSFFASQNSLQTEGLAMSKNDYYLAHWSKSIVPIFDKDESFSVFEKENKWLDSYLPNAEIRKAHHLHVPKKVPSLIPHFKMFESFFRSIQRHRFPSQIKDLANVDSRVVINDEMLKFHENDRRELFKEKYQTCLAKHL